MSAVVLSFGCYEYTNHVYTTLENRNLCQRDVVSHDPFVLDPTHRASAETDADLDLDLYSLNSLSYNLG